MNHVFFQGIPIYIYKPSFATVAGCGVDAKYTREV